jgi:hypothetical protein
MTTAYRLAILAGLALACAAGVATSAIGQRSATARPSDHGRSTIVYPPQRITLRMDHSHPAHRELECVRCHASAASAERSEQRLVPEEATCLPCHAAQIDRARTTTETCGTCHVGFEAGVDAGPAPAVPASTFPAPRLRFSHRAHVADGQTCESCHAGVRDARLATRRHLPTMRDCFRCHAPSGLGEGVASRPLECEQCHVATPAGQLRTRWPEGWMNPPRWMAGMRHDHEWLVRHRWVGADQGPLCAECHTERDCADCHDGRVRPRSVHPGDFLTTHAAMARRDASIGGGGRCASCHTISQFCAECHGRLGIAPIAAPEVRSADRWHPPPAVWLRGPNLHALEATRSMQTCASCHAEEDCVQCHGASGIGAGVSPHPPGFAASCRTALETNARACITCHGDPEELRARCR